MSDGDMIFLRCFLMIAIPVGVLGAMMMGWWVFCIIMMFKAENDLVKAEENYRRWYLKKRKRLDDLYKNGKRND